MSKYAWVVDAEYRDSDTAFEAPTLESAERPLRVRMPPVLRITGPRTADMDLIRRLLGSAEGEPFKLMDGDGEVMGEGRILGEYDGFEPLDEFGEGAWGAATIRYHGPGGWQDL